MDPARLPARSEHGQSSAYSPRIESFNNDPRSLYIENQASFGPVMVEQGLDRSRRTSSPRTVSSSRSPAIRQPLRRPQQAEGCAGRPHFLLADPSPLILMGGLLGGCSRSGRSAGRTAALRHRAPLVLNDADPRRGCRRVDTIASSSRRMPLEPRRSR
jgi:hypothetical protein